MKKLATLATFAAAIMMILSSCSGSGSGNSLLFGDLPSEFAKFKTQRDKLDEEAKNVKTEAEKAEIIKKGEKLEKKWSPKLEKASAKLDGKEINFSDSFFKVTSPVSLTFEKLSSRTLEPVFKINGSVETAETITVEKTFSQTQAVYIAGCDGEGNELYTIRVGRITGDVNGNTLVIPAGTPVVFSNLTFNGSYVDKYPEAKTLKFIYK